MSERNSKNLSRRHFLGLSVGAVVSAGIGCSSESNTSSGTGGQTGTGGAGTGGTGGGATGTGAGAGTGGMGVGVSGGAGGGLTGGAGGTSTGGAGGSSTSGGTAGGTTGGAGGNPTGGAGGTSTGGAGGSTGGSSTGGTSGSSTGGASGSTTGGAGGSTTGGAGGTATGGSDQSTGGADGTGGSGSTELGYVTLVRATDWKTAVKDACLARMPDLTGKKVVVRPNVIDGTANSTTSPEVVAGIVAAAKEKGAASIVVAEDGFGGNCLESMQQLGITAAIGTDATPMNLNGTATTHYSPANATAWNDTDGIDFYDEVKNADYVINAPKCKCHLIANFTMALKAWFGSIQRPSGTALHRGVHDKAAEAHLVRQEDLVVLDATRSMTSGGPQSGTMADSNLVVVTEDAIAADVTGVAIIRANGGQLLPPWQQPQIERALALGFPGWLNAETDFSYSLAGISQADADAIMAQRS